MNTRQKELIKFWSRVKGIIFAISFIGMILLSCVVDCKDRYMIYIIIGYAICFIGMGVSFLIEKYMIRVFKGGRFRTIYYHIDKDVQENADYYDYIDDNNLRDTDENYNAYNSMYGN